jgi:hypothetical protein
MNILKKIMLGLCFVVMASPVMAQEDDDSKGILNIVVENDLVSGKDENYTNGIRFAWISSEEGVPGLARSIAEALPFTNDGKKRISIAIGQNMYTSQNKTSTEVVPGDHPYAGWLYGSVGMVSDTGTRLDNVMLTVGVVGPLSHAKQSQFFVHDVMGYDKPKGWNNQLHNEPGAILTYERKWRNLYELSPFGLGMDATPLIGVNLGNVSTDASVGATFRMGFDLPADYGPPRIRPSLPGSDFFLPTKKLSGYLFTTIGGRVVGRDIFLDGNTFGNSPSVDKEILVGSLQAGAAITYKDMRLSYTQVYMTKEYKTQKNNSVFGVVTASWRF